MVQCENRYPSSRRRRPPGGFDRRHLHRRGLDCAFYNADGFEPLFGGKLVGSRHAEDGRLYAILKDDDDDRTREEPVDLFPFADVQVGPNSQFGRRITAVAVEYGPAAVTVNLIVPFAELVTGTRPYSEDEADYLL